MEREVETIDFLDVIEEQFPSNSPGYALEYSCLIGDKIVLEGAISKDGEDQPFKTATTITAVTEVPSKFGDNLLVSVEFGLGVRFILGHTVVCLRYVAGDNKLELETLSELGNRLVHEVEVTAFRQ